MTINTPNYHQPSPNHQPPNQTIFVCRTWFNFTISSRHCTSPFSTSTHPEWARCWWMGGILTCCNSNTCLHGCVWIWPSWWACRLNLTCRSTFCTTPSPCCWRWTFQVNVSKDLFFRWNYYFREETYFFFETTMFIYFFFLTPNDFYDAHLFFINFFLF